MKGKNLCQKNKIQLLLLCRPGQAKVSRLQYQFDREYGIWLWFSNTAFGPRFFRTEIC